MNASDEITNLVLALPQTERASLARRLLLSLEPDDFDEDGEAAWAAEIEKRMTAVERGNFRATDWREAIARIRKNLAHGRPQDGRLQVRVQDSLHDRARVGIV